MIPPESESYQGLERYRTKRLNVFSIYGVLFEIIFDYVGRLGNNFVNLHEAVDYRITDYRIYCLLTSLSITTLSISCKIV